MKYQLSTSLSGKLDKAKGTIRDVSIITEGPALGHGVDIDTKTLSQIFEQTKGQVVKAYWKHGGLFDGDRLGEEVGLFSAFHIVGRQVKAHFQVLEAFRKNFPERWDYLTELVEKAPKEFGVSIHFEGSAAWKLEDGSEVAADAPRPANAVGENPFVRIDKLISADFVGQPAANAGGLFSQGKVTELLDTKQRLTGELSKLAANVASAAEQLKAKDTAFTELAAKYDSAVKAFDAERAAFAVKETEFAAQKSGLEATINELSANVAKLSADIETHKTEAATKDKEYKAQVESLNKTLLEFGAVPKNIYSVAVDNVATFTAITDRQQKTRYWKQHKKEILAAA